MKKFLCTLLVIILNFSIMNTLAESADFMAEITIVKDGEIITSFNAIDGAIVIPPIEGDFEVVSNTHEIFDMVYLSEGVEKMPNFNGVKMRNLFIPRSCVEIESKQYKAETVNYVVDVCNHKYLSKDGVLYSKDGTKLISYGLSRTDSIFIIPEGVKTIGSYAFFGIQGIEELVIPNSVESIEHHAFAKINYRKSFDDNVKWMNSIVIPESVNTFDCSSLEDANVEKIYLPEFDDISSVYTNVMRTWNGKILVKNNGKTQKWLSDRGYLTFDDITEEIRLPTFNGNIESVDGEAYDLRILYDSSPNDTNMDAVSMIFPEDDVAFVTGGRLYVPLRYMCEKFEIPLSWNSEKMIAEVGETNTLQNNIKSEAIFGDENIVRYNGKILSALTCEAEYSKMQSSKQLKSHTSINIEGKIYVPIIDLARSGVLEGGTLIAIKGDILGVFIEHRN